MYDELTNHTCDPEPEVAELKSVEPIMGLVADCSKLNMRAEPSADAEIVCQLKVGTEVLIDDDESTDIFYKVCTNAGIEGFCMKKFIKIE